MAGDVLGGNAARALRQRLGISSMFFFCKLPFWMAVEVSAVAGQSKHEQQFGVQAWRGYARCRKRLNSEIQGLTEGHATIVIMKGGGSGETGTPGQPVRQEGQLTRV